MKKFYKFIDMIFILLVMDSFTDILHSVYIVNLESIFFLLKIVIYIVVIMRLYKLKFKKIGWRSLVLYNFLGYCLLNVMISKSISDSVQSIIYLFLNVIYAYTLYCEYSIEEVIEIVIRPLFLVNVISTIVAIFTPAYGRYYDLVYSVSVWKGIFTHKNTLGSISALTIIVLILNLNYKKIEYKQKILFISASLNLFFSYSHTPQYTLVICLGYLFIKKVFHKEIALSIFNWTLLINYIYIFQYKFIQKIYLGHSMDISGRRIIYDTVLKLIDKNSYIGNGLGSVWMENKGIAAVTVTKYIGFNTNSSHNGFLEIALQIGYVGLLIYIILIGSIFLKATKSYFDNMECNNLMVLMIFIIIMSIFESTLAEFRGIYWIIQIYILFEIDRKEERKLNESLIMV